MPTYGQRKGYVGGASGGGGHKDMAGSAAFLQDCETGVLCWCTLLLT
jgi:hypothetical protein